MRGRGGRAAALLTWIVLAGCEPAAEPFLPQFETIDILIEDGNVLDGLGNAPVRADVVIVDDRIVFIGDAAFTPSDIAERVQLRIDAAGKAVAPGFIDLHSHGDPLEAPAFENFLAMGVTTITLGQDGSSPAVEPLSDWLQQVSDAGVAPNIAMFVGHGTLRELAGIGRGRNPSPDAMRRMLALLDETLDYTFGLSTGLEYNPGLNAGSAELVAMAKVVGRHDRLIMSHLRNEDDDRLETSIAELLEQGEYARVHVSHLKSVYGRGEQRAEELLALIASAREAGIEVTADVYPYTASYTGIGILFPVWAKTAEQFTVAKHERRTELEEWLRRRVESRNGPEATLLGTAPWTGRTLAEVAFEQEADFEDVLIDDIGPQGASAAYFVMDSALQARLLADPFVGICSDGSPMGFHPRGHGSFAKIIETYVVDEGVLTLAEAVRKMTSFPASLLRIEDRGVLAPGMQADVVVFDPAAVRAVATYDSPHRLSEGFDTVIVNGRLAFQDGHATGALPGRVLRPSDGVGPRSARRPADLPGDARGIEPPADELSAHLEAVRDRPDVPTPREARQEAVTRQEQGGGQPVRLAFLLPAVSAEPEVAVFADVDSGRGVAENDVRQLVHDAVRDAPFVLRRIDDDDVPPVEPDGNGRPAAGVANR